jgi:hypothetical protein
MGGDAGTSSKATNIVENATNILMDVGMQASNMQKTIIIAEQSVEIVNNSGEVDVVFGGSQVVQLDTVAMQNGYFNGSFDTEISTMIDQVSEAVAEAAGFQSGTAESENITRLVTNLSYAINIAYFQECTNTVSLKQSAKVVNNSGKINIVFGGDQTIDMLADCTQTTNAVVSIKNKLITEITQKATSKVTSSLWAMILLCSMIIIILALIIFTAMTDLIKAGVAIVVIILIVFGVWLGYAAMTGSPPFDKEAPPPDTSGATPAQEKKELSEAPEALEGEIKLMPTQWHDVYDFESDGYGTVAIMFKARGWQYPKSGVRIECLDGNGNVKRAQTLFVTNGETPLTYQIPQFSVSKGKYSFRVTNAGVDVIYVTERGERGTTLSSTNTLVIVSGLTSETESFNFDAALAAGSSGSGKMNIVYYSGDNRIIPNVGTENAVSTYKSTFTALPLNLTEINKTQTEPITKYSIAVNNAGTDTIVVYI